MKEKTYIMVVSWKVANDRKQPILPELIDGQFWRSSKIKGEYGKTGLVKVEATYR